MNFSLKTCKYDLDSSSFVKKLVLHCWTELTKNVKNQQIFFLLSSPQ